MIYQLLPSPTWCRKRFVTEAGGYNIHILKEMQILGLLTTSMKRVLEKLIVAS
jgi:hypothetical protein